MKKTIEWLRKIEYVKVGGHRVRVRFPYEFKERTDLKGQYDDTTREIRVSERDAGGEEYSPCSIIQTFFHEVGHAIEADRGSTLFRENEKIWDSLIAGIIAFLVDNEFLEIA